MSLEISIEFFPPQTAEGMEKLRATRSRLAVLRPEFFSVTYGAGGSTRERTLATVMEIAAEGHSAAPHLSCIGSTREGIREMLAIFTERGIRRIVALRGDLPSGMADAGEFRYANELVAFIRAETGDRFHIEVAAYPEWHPQARSPREDLLNFKRKVDAGANSAITQYFYNTDAYEHFVAEARALGVNVPVVPGSHADRQLFQAGALFGRLRRRDPALDAAQVRELRRRLGIDPRLRPRCRYGTLPAPDRTRRAGPAFLFDEPGGADAGALPPPWG